MKRLFVCLVLGLSLVWTSTALAASHHLPGGGGYKEPALPPKGFYFKYYNAFYQAQQTNHGNWGKNTASKTHSGSDYNLFRFIYNTGVQVLGGDLVCDFIVPLAYVTNRIDDHYGYKSRFDIGDMQVDPVLLAWHGSWYDALVGLSVFVPTGYFSVDPNWVNTGAGGFWTFMLDLGAVIYFDDAKTWSTSLTARYQVHTIQEQTNLLPGQNAILEWSFGKSVNEYLDLAVSGYCYWDTTRTSGEGAHSIYKADELGTAYAVGPEIGVNLADYGVFLTLRHEWEVAASNHTLGSLTLFSITKAF